MSHCFSTLALCLLTLCAAHVAAAATFTVNSTADTMNGTCDTTSCTLREAIHAANGAAGDDIISFDATTFGNSPQTIDLFNSLPTLSTSVDLQGPGANLLTVRRAQGTHEFGIFMVDNGTAAGPTVSISGLIISRGNSDKGGAIFNIESTLTIRNCIIRGNSADYGGGIYTSEGTLTVRNCIIRGNSARNGNGGGILNTGGTVNIRNSTIGGNAAIGNGGGIFGLEGAMTVQNSTLSGNTATSVGGGIANSSGTLTVLNSTLSGNSAMSAGGGISSRYNGAQARVVNSIVAGNRASTYPYPNLFGAITKRYSITSGPAAAAGLEVDSNGVPVLKNNGGPTPTIALLSGSPAIDAGNGASAPGTDQRGYGRTGVSDMGAFEFNGVPPVVDSTSSE